MNHRFITLTAGRETEIRTNSKLSRTDTNTCIVVVGMSLHPLVPSTAIQNYTAVEMFQHAVNLVPPPSDQQTNCEEMVCVYVCQYDWRVPWV